MNKRNVAIPGPLVVLTDRVAAARAGRTLRDTVAAAVDAGAHAVLFREKDLDCDGRAALAREVAAVVRDAGARVGIASDHQLAHALDVDWVHLSAADALPHDAAGQPVIGRSCHNIAELHAANAEGVAYASFSPVLVTASKPGYGPAIGFASFAAACAQHTMPIVALGGLGTDTGSVAAARAAGAAAVWVMGAVMAAEDPSRVVRALLHELTVEVAS